MRYAVLLLLMVSPAWGQDFSAFPTEPPAAPALDCSAFPAKVPVLASRCNCLTCSCKVCECTGAKCACASCAAVALRLPVGHTHTCNKCGLTWDHSTNPGHACANCGTTQYVQDSVPRMVTTARYTLGGCANGQCESVQSQRRGLFGLRR